MSADTSKVLMWLGWIFAALTAVLTSHYLPSGDRINTFAGPFGIFHIGVLLIPTLLAGGLRFWAGRIRNGWGKLLVWCAGLFMAFFVTQVGIFLVPEFLALSQVIGSALYLLYLPLFVKFVRTAPTVPPPLPGEA